MSLQQDIVDAAERACGAKVQFEEVFPVIETEDGKVIWAGVVTQFDSANGRVFAWAVEAEPEPQFVAVRQQPPVITPLAAVRSWMVSHRRDGKV